MSNNIIESLIENSEKYSDKVALVDVNCKISYQELLKKIKGLAITFKNKGISKGDKVFVHYNSPVAFYQILLASLYLGAVPVFVDSNLEKNDFKDTLLLAGCKAFVSDVWKFSFLLPKEIKNIPVKLFGGIEKLYSKSEDHLEPELLQDDDKVLVYYKTNNTGEITTYNFTHYQLENYINDLASLKELLPSDIEFSSLNLNVLANLVFGSTTILVNYKKNDIQKIDIKRAIKDIEEYIINSLCLNTTYLDEIASYCELNRIKFKSLKKVFCFGSIVSPAFAIRMLSLFQDISINIIFCYLGFLPISSISARNLVKLSDKFDKKGLTVGEMFKQESVKIFDLNENNQLSDGEVGEVSIEISFKDEVPNNYLRTGYTGYVDVKSNLLYITGEINNSVEFGNRVYPSLISEYKLSNIENIKCGTLVEVDKTIYVVAELFNKTPNGQIEAVNKIKKTDLFFHQIVILNEIPKDSFDKFKIDYKKLKEQVKNFNRV